jgi:hypothetical protein
MTHPTDITPEIPIEHLDALVRSLSRHGCVGWRF